LLRSLTRGTDMDPNEALRRFREEWFKAINAAEPNKAIEHMCVAAQIAHDLDQWISSGGFPPADWSRGNTITGDVNGKIIQAGSFVGNVDMTG
jgi:hypothetical protein